MNQNKATNHFLIFSINFPLNIKIPFFHTYIRMFRIFSNYQIISHRIHMTNCHYIIFMKLLFSIVVSLILKWREHFRYSFISWIWGTHVFVTSGVKTHSMFHRQKKQGESNVSTTLKSFWAIGQLLWDLAACQGNFTHEAWRRSRIPRRDL